MENPGMRRLKDLIELDAFLFDGVPEGEGRERMLRQKSMEEHNGKERVTDTQRFGLCVNQEIRITQLGALFGSVANISYFTKEFVAVPVFVSGERKVCLFTPDEIQVTI